MKESGARESGPAIVLNAIAGHPFLPHAKELRIFRRKKQMRHQLQRLALIPKNLRRFGHRRLDQARNDVALLTERLGLFAGAEIVESIEAERDRQAGKRIAMFASVVPQAGAFGAGATGAGLVVAGLLVGHQQAGVLRAGNQRLDVRGVDLDTRGRRDFAEADRIRKELAAQALKGLHDEAVWVFLWQLEQLTGVSKKVKGFKIRADDFVWVRDTYVEA